ncbi:hypothetical protein GCM10010406_20370 [Streptomyces thermolineatus]|uniref:Putative Flp pilus-assembly TadG-like N-terminal domain-containing protein n=1 Tax=Streptomyces thermolineatus TaxID=44033 RepID=A0ABN3LKI2_9ACTN
MRGGGDRGSATVWATGAAAAVCVLLAGMLALGQAVGVRHRAGAAADLAALAAADSALEGERKACGRALRAAAANGARLARCTVRGEVSDVTVHVRAAGLLGVLPPAEVRSRAGPADVTGLTSPAGPTAPAGPP